MKVIKINEEQYKFYINALDKLIEGVEFKNNGDGSIDMNINTNTEDAYNTGQNSVDTRVFGTLKLVIDVLQEKLPSQTDKNILCLTNAYSSSGR